MPVQNGYHLQWLAFRTVDDDVIRVLGEGPEKHRQRGDIPPFMAYEGISGEPAACGDNLRFHPVGGFRAVFLNEPLDAIKVFGCLGSELEGRTHPRVFKRAARR